MTCALLTCALPASAHAGSLALVSDVIATSSAPSALTTNHTIKFTTVNAIPASGSIIITPESGSFDMQSDLDYTDIDLAVWNGSAYADRTLASTAGAGADGVTVVTGTSGSITITLNSTSGIGASAAIQIEIGSNATVGATGDRYITNPSTTGSYRLALETRDASSVKLDALNGAMIAITQPVTVSGVMIAADPVRSNGLPSGTVQAGHDSIEISLNTDVAATCRFALASSTDYDVMPNSFSSSASSTTHFTTLSGFEDGQTYSYFVRCRGLLYGVANPFSYEITFSIAPSPISQTSVTQESLGRGGAGDFRNGSAQVYLAVVSIVGYSSPGSTVTVLKDGVKQIATQAKSDGSFKADLPRMERGTYTFLTYAEDSRGRRSAADTATISLVGGTINTITDVVVPPTIMLSKTSVSLAEEVLITGESVPNAKVEVAVQKVGSGNPSDLKKFTATTTGSIGAWEVKLNSKDLTKGTWDIKARTIVSTQLESSVSNALRLGVGAVPALGGAAQGDINGDGKMNLIDFSIMLSHWGTDDANADFNHDGVVSLADFSILLFNWTG